MLTFARNLLTPSNSSVTHGTGHTLWIDGVGCFWVLLNDRVTIGGPEPIVAKASDASESAELALLSDLRRQHAAIVRTGEGYLLEAGGSARVAGREVIGRTALGDGANIELGRSVRLRFRQPSALSLSACVDFLSDHRPAQAVDGVVLLADTCLLGPGEENHIVCPDWPGTVLLVRQGHELWCRSRMNVAINGQRIGSGRKLESGDVVMGEELRFRIEDRG